MFPFAPGRSHLVRWLPATLALLAFATISLRPAAAAEELDRKFRDAADRILQRLREQNCKSVGVLPFGVQRPNEGTRYNQGLVNQNLADRLELAMLFANDKNDPIDILSKASSTIAKSNLKGDVNHLKPQGRQQLMALQYPRAWRDAAGRVAMLQPDVLLTGVAKISLNPRETFVSVQAIYRSNTQQDPVEIERIQVGTDVRTMSESGGSYVATRGLFTAGQLKFESVHFGAEHQGGLPPVAGGVAAPIRLTIYYDGHAVPYEAASMATGIARIPEPGPHVKDVWFEIERTAFAGNRTYGVVVKVNGENTFYKQKEEPIHCTKWLLTPEWTKTKITGYQLDDKRVEKFRILSDAESAAKEVDYDRRYIGQISIMVFAAESEVALKLPPPEIKIGDPAIREMEENAIARAQVPTGVFPSLEAVQEEARGQAEAAVTTGNSRGLIGSGEVGKSHVQFVEFKAYPVPVMIDCISYYKNGLR